MVKPYKTNAAHLEKELAWLADIIRERYAMHKAGNSKKPDIEKIKVQGLRDDQSLYKRVVTEFKLLAAERIVLLLALIPHIRPFFLDDIAAGPADSAPAPFVPGKSGSLPTVDLCLFILAGDDLEKRFYYQRLFEPESFFIKHGILLIEPDDTQSSLLQQQIKISNEYLFLLTAGREFKPGYSSQFPAKRIETELSWKDLILNAQTLEMVNEIKTWILHHKILMEDWELNKRLSPGYKVLFYGKPGTGKTFTASLLGKETGMDIYKIDLSMIVSKYIGETEKNLSRIFDQANNKSWILFFDEADALFGKRTELKDSHDRFANQEVAFLLQKIEEHNGVVILSSNMRNNIDEAFTRRFQDMIPFYMPDEAERLKIWQQSFSQKTTLAKDIDLKKIAGQYELSGGSIMNIIRYASLKAVEAGGSRIHLEDILKGISKEYRKDGRRV
jgi:hypothetical protein